MDIVKLLCIIFIATLICVIFKQYKPEYATLIAICTALLVLTAIIGTLSTSLSVIEQKLADCEIDGGNFKIALKALGIGYTTAFVADACRDAGQSALATKAELAGKCAIFILSVPLMLNILEIALGFIK